MLEFR